MHSVSIIHHWAGCPKSANSKWQRFLSVVQRCGGEGWRNYLVWSRLPDDSALVEPFRDAGCEIVLQSRSRGNFDAGSIRRTFRLLRRLQCDIFHCHNDHTSPLIGATLARVPVRIWSKLSMSSFYETATVPRGMQRIYLSNRISSCCSHRILALTEAVGGEFVQQGGSPRKTIVVPAPVDVERFAAAGGDGVREELGLSHSDLLVTAVGHAVPVKGWDILLRAFAKLAPEQESLRLILVGSTSAPDEIALVKSLQSIAVKAGCADRVHLLGHRSDAAEILKASDVFAFPSRSDGQGLALVEAMAAGLPCIAASVGGIPEIITHNVNGLLFERENVGQLADRLRCALSEATLRRRLGEAAEQTSRAFSIETYVEAVFSLYCHLLEKRGSRRGQCDPEA